uniref:CSTF2_hinge domain-containing protein n=1 Tax=Heterorhabditis bacteriophora TaxID=37862 RepID=A0A1I7XF59_HETBA
MFTPEQLQKVWMQLALQGMGGSLGANLSALQALHANMGALVTGGPPQSLFPAIPTALPVMNPGSPTTSNMTTEQVSK